MKPLAQRLWVTLLVFGGLAAAAILLGPLAGPTSISLRSVFDRSIPFSENVDAQIFFVARLPRTLAGALVGAMLASAGVVFQGLLRNPLATPFTLGVSAGAALGAMLAITFGSSLHWLGVPLAPWRASWVHSSRWPLSTFSRARGTAACRRTSCCWRASR